jgi:hypothetical protein
VIGCTTSEGIQVATNTFSIPTLLSAGPERETMGVRLLISTIFVFVTVPPALAVVTVIVFVPISSQLNSI